MGQIAQRPPDVLVTIVSDHWTAPYWNAARDFRLTCAQCRNCQRFRMPPSPFCPNCRSQEIELANAARHGHDLLLHDRQAGGPAGTEDSIPYVVAVVDLDGAPGTRLITNIVDSDIDAIRIGAPVSVLSM